MSDELLDKVLSPNSTYYDILGVSTTANTNEIRSAYKKTALKLHPDKYSGTRKEDAKEAFLLITDAHETLTDERLRSIYNETLKKKEREKRNESQGQRQRYNQSYRQQEGVYTQNQTYTSNNRFNPHPDWSSEKRTAYAFWMFIKIVESDLLHGVESDENTVGVTVLGSLAAVDTGFKFLSKMIEEEPGIFLMLGGISLAFLLFASSEQKQLLLSNAYQLLNWNNWNRSLKLKAINYLKNYYKKSFQNL